MNYNENYTAAIELNSIPSSRACSRYFSLRPPFVLAVRYKEIWGKQHNGISTACLLQKENSAKILITRQTRGL